MTLRSRKSPLSLLESSWQPADATKTRSRCLCCSIGERRRITNSKNGKYRVGLCYRQVLTVIVYCGWFYFCGIGTLCQWCQQRRRRWRSAKRKRRYRANAMAATTDGYVGVQSTSWIGLKPIIENLPVLVNAVEQPCNTRLSRFPKHSSKQTRPSSTLRWSCFETSLIV